MENRAVQLTLTAQTEVQNFVLFIFLHFILPVTLRRQMTNRISSIINTGDKQPHLRSCILLFPQELQRFPSALRESCWFEYYCYRHPSVLGGNFCFDAQLQKLNSNTESLRGIISTFNIQDLSWLRQNSHFTLLRLPVCLLIVFAPFHQHKS